VAKREGKTEDEIEEMGVATGGLDQNQQIVQQFEDYKSIISIKGLNTPVWVWERPDGKQQKSIPAAVKEKYPQEITNIRKKIKSLKSALPAQRDRMEGFYLKQRKWSYKEFSTYYIEHPLMAHLAKKLIWFFKNGEQKTTAIFYNNQWQNPMDDDLSWINKETEIQLWHPIGFSAEYISN